MKKQINALLVASMLVTGVSALGVSPAAYAQGTVTQAQQNAPKSDYQNHPSKAAIDYVLTNKLMWKYGDGTFKPDVQMTQGQLITSLVAIMQLKEKTPLPQIPVGHWAKDNYEKANKAGLFTEVTIDPNRVLTKEEASLIIVNAWKPYRGNKYPTITHYQFLRSTGWLPKVWGQTEESSFLRGEGASILQILHREFNGIILGRKAADQFHASLKVTNNVLTGTYPKMAGLNIIGTIYTKDGKSFYFKAGDTIKITASNVKVLTFISQLKGESPAMSSYSYTELPKLTRKNEMIKNE